MAGAAQAQVVTDGTMGTGRALNGPNVLIPAALGRRAGSNLFHSFLVFNVPRGESATFTDLGGIANVIARVTSGTRSDISGTIRVEGNEANLFLVNPAGFVFGNGASLNVPAAFYAVSAHEVRFADGTRFGARLADGVTLSAAAPAGFGFRGAGGSITVSGAVLATRPGTTLGLVGAAVVLQRAGGVNTLLSAPAGQVVLAGLGDAATGFSLGPMPTADAANGRVAILDGTRVTVSEAANASTGSGRVFIRAGDIVLEHARIEANTRRGAGGAIDIRADEAVVADGAEVVALTFGAGNAGTIRIAGRDVAIRGGSLVDTSCEPGCTSGNAGALDVSATRSIVVHGEGAVETNVVANSFGGGDSGRVTLAAPRIDISGASFVQSVTLAAGSSRGIALLGDIISVTDGAQVAASSRGTGRGGAVEVTARELLLSGYREQEGGAILRSGLFANAEASGDAGSVHVRASRMQVRGGAEVSSSAALRATGNGGLVHLVVDGLLEVSGYERMGADGVPVGPSAIVTNTFGPGRGGEVRIEAGRVEVSDRGRIQSQSEGSGAAGRIDFSVGDLVVASGGAISSRAGGTGDGGAIRIRATGSVELRGINTGLFAETVAAPAGARGGDGGTIEVQARSVTLDDGAVIFATTKGSGDGGSIVVDAESIRLAAGTRIVSESLPAENQGGLTPGIAGDISLTAARTVELRGAVATRTNLADGGNVQVRAGELMLLVDGSVTTEVGRGAGDGGNVDLAAPSIVLLDAVVNANAFGGRGGNIQVGAPAFILSPRSLITASSRLGIDGTIQIDSPALDVAGVLGAPATRYLQDDLVLAGRCQARLAGKASALAFAAPSGAQGFMLPMPAAQCVPPGTSAFR